MPTTPEDLMRRIWSEIPSVDCKGLCTDSCTMAPATALENRMVMEAGGASMPTGEDAVAFVRSDPRTMPDPCANLTDEGKCGVYDVRPTICRLWGATEALPCPHDCLPASGRRMGRAKDRALLGRALALGDR